ncbi:MAG: iron-sulfur cluster assembly scaffold protein [Alphaproteobacteria bacterium]|nr:iron-sulfur cluster assembly scaffold protein [Alphaproteobacteria bacterium]
MTDLDAIYSNRILELAAAIPRCERLPDPHTSATAHSKLCGSTVAVDIKVADGVVSDFGQNIKACLLGQAAASVVGREIVGTSIAEFAEVAATMRAMLKESGPPPQGRWADLGVLEPVRDYKARHTSTLLIFDAVLDAFGQLEQSRGNAVAGQKS